MVLILCLSLVPLALVQAQIQTQTTWLTYTNSNFGFTIKYPSDWAVNSTSTSTSTNITGQSVNSATFVPPDRVAAVIASSVPLPSSAVGKSLENITAIWIGAKYFRPLQLSTDYFLSGYPAAKMVMIGYDIEVMAVAIDVGNRLYGVVYSTHPADYSKYLLEAQQMIDSFELEGSR